MKLSISISNSTALVATNVFPAGNVMVRDVVVCIVADGFSTSLQLTNNHLDPVSYKADTANLWLLIGKYKRLHYMLVLLSSG